MIDRLVLRCFFRTGCLDFDLRTLSIPLVGAIDADGRLHHVRHAWESLPSSFSGLAFKVFYNPESTIQPEPYIEIKASPAKIAQGHNLYGSDDLAECALTLINAFADIYPHVLAELDERTWEVAEVDVTYFSRAKSQCEAEAFIAALMHVSKGQTKARAGFQGTAYFGKTNSRLKRLKVYAKLKEVIHYVEDQARKGDPFGVCAIYTPELLAFANGMIRWEATLKKRWFERRQLPTSLFKLREVWRPVEFWKEATADVFDALRGQSMKLNNDADVLKALKERLFTVNAKTGKKSFGRAYAAYKSYREIKRDGFEQWAETTAHNTRYRHLRDLHACGISRASLQNMRGDGVGGEVVPFIRYIGVDFGAQFPEWDQEAQSRRLKLVAVDNKRNSR